MNATPPHRTSSRLLALGLLIGAAQATPPAQAGDAPVELGAIAWLRNFDVALTQATAQKRPLLVLFDEVPGCGTCVDYGNNVLSHPLIVEAAESLFLPVAVYNNVKGPDEQVLKSFDEPAWNNPVIRILNPNKDPLIPRLADDYTVGALANAMVAALKKTDTTVPSYLGLLAEETATKPAQLQTATFAMHCFWEGEAALGKIPGVVHTRPGFLHDVEVVEVRFDPATVAFGDLLTNAQAQKCADKVFTRTPDQHAVASSTLVDQAVRSTEPIKVDKQPKYYLAQSAYRYLPMTELQAARVNAALHFKTDPNAYLSPRQLELYAAIKANPRAGWAHTIGTTNLPAAWKTAQSQASQLAAARSK